MPLFRGAASKAILASLPKRVVRQFHTQNLDEMKASGLGATFQQVYASLSMLLDGGVCTTSGELDAGLTGFATPLIGADALPVGSLGLVVADSKLSPAVAGNLKRLLKASADQVTATLQLV